MFKKAILVAANPYQKYIISDILPPTKDLGDVEFHREHCNKHGGVFWDVIPSGRVDTPWNHPEISSGYFYISQKNASERGLVKYRMKIEYIKRWKEIDLKNVKEYIPEPRRIFLKANSHAKTYYAILIRKLEPLKIHRELAEFTLVSAKKKVERVQNYVIVHDLEYR